MDGKKPDVTSPTEILSLAFNLDFDAKLGDGPNDNALRHQGTSVGLRRDPSPGGVESAVAEANGSGHDETGPNQDDRDSKFHGAKLLASSINPSASAIDPEQGDARRHDTAPPRPETKRPRRSSESKQNLVDNMQRQLRLLLSQNGELRRSIATSSRSSHQLDDDVLRQSMNALYFEIQDWVVNNTRKSKLGKAVFNSSSSRSRTVLLRPCRCESTECFRNGENMSSREEHPRIGQVFTMSSHSLLLCNANLQRGFLLWSAVAGRSVKFADCQWSNEGYDSCVDSR